MTVRLTAKMFHRTITTEHPSMIEADQRIVDIAVAQGCRTETARDNLSGTWIANQGPLADEDMGTWTVEEIIELEKMTPRTMIALNAPDAIGLVNVVLWVHIIEHTNDYIKNPRPYGLLKITEIGLDGQIIQAVFSENGINPFVMISDAGFRNVAFEILPRRF